MATFTVEATFTHGEFGIGFATVTVDADGHEAARVAASRKIKDDGDYAGFVLMHAITKAAR